MQNMPTKVEVVHTPYNASAIYNSALIQGQEGFNAVLRSIIGQNLFPKVKFFDNDSELMYNEHTSSICGSMLQWLGVQKNDSAYKFSLWSNNYKNIKMFHTQHQNNVIKKFQVIGNSKFHFNFN